MGLSIKNNTVKQICLCGGHLPAGTVKCHMSERRGEKSQQGHVWGRGDHVASFELCSHLLVSFKCSSPVICYLEERQADKSREGNLLVSFREHVLMEFTVHLGMWLIILLINETQRWLLILLHSLKPQIN